MNSGNASHGNGQSGSEKRHWFGKRWWIAGRTGYRRRYKAIQKWIDILLLISCFLAGIMIFFIFCTNFISSKADFLLINSFQYADTSGMKPTAAVQLIATVIQLGTIAYATRQIEKFLWLRLKPGNKGLTLGELDELSYFAESALGRVSYFFAGANNYKKALAFFLLPSAVVGPILLQGISVVDEGVKQGNTERPSQSRDGGSSFSFNGWMGGRFLDKEGWNDGQEIYNGNIITSTAGK